MISVNEAIEKVLKETYLTGIDEMPSINAIGLILAEDILSDIDIPPFNRATMDGFAMKAATIEPFKEIKVVAVLAAGDSYKPKIRDGEAVKVLTGAPVPDECDTVVPIEEILPTYSNNQFTLKIKPRAGRNIAYRGEEIKKGSLVIQKGTKIGSAEASVLAQVGYTKVKVYRRPKVSILVTGSELVEPEKMPEWGQIRESNSYGLLAQCSIWGAEGHNAGNIIDDPQKMEKELEDILKHKPDILLITGGVSVGDYDFVPHVLSKIKAEIIFHNVAQKPAKPILFSKYNKTLIFGLPGNPVASFLGFELYVGPLIRRMLGESQYQTNYMTAIASGEFNISSDREYFYPARVHYAEDKWIADPVKTLGSADIASIANANAFARFEKGKYTVSKGDKVRFFFIRGKDYGA